LETDLSSLEGPDSSIIASFFGKGYTNEFTNEDNARYPTSSREQRFLDLQGQQKEITESTRVLHSTRITTFKIQIDEDGSYNLEREELNGPFRINSSTALFKATQIFSKQSFSRLHKYHQIKHL